MTINTKDIHKERIREYVQALKTGRYTQIIGRLAKGEGCFCVSGVACEVSQLGRWERYLDGTPDRYIIGENPNPSDSILIAPSDSILMPPEVANYYGFSRTLPEVYVKEDTNNAEGFEILERSLQFLNDHKLMSFDEMANLIEDTYLKEPAMI